MDKVLRMICVDFSLVYELLFDILHESNTRTMMCVQYTICVKYQSNNVCAVHNLCQIPEQLCVFSA